MLGYTIQEAAERLNPTNPRVDYFRNRILFSGKPDPILKPCVFFPQPRSFRIIKIDGQQIPPGIEYSPKHVTFDIGNGRTRSFGYDSAHIQGLFELTLFPDYFNMEEAKESGYIQLYRKKAVFADYLAEFSIDMAVGWIMSGWKEFDGIHNRWCAMTASDASETKSRIRSKVGEFIILSQNGIHYLVDTPASVLLSDIRITDKMLMEYAASEGIKLPANHTTPIPPEKQSVKQSTVEFNLQENIPIRFIEFYTNGKLGPETAALFFAHKQGIDWNRRMDTEDKLTAYHWQHGKVTAIKRTEWESVVNSIQSLSERYDKTNRHFDEWRTAALKLLPVAFVRRSEFDAVYRRAMSPERIIFVDQSRNFERLTGDEDREARQTNDTAYIPPELVGIVFEGFGHGMNTSDTKSETRQKRHIITQEERRAKGKSAIQLAVEAYLDGNQNGNKAGFYTFLKQQIKLPQEVTLKDGESYAYFFKEVKEKGTQEGVYLNHPKEKKKEGDPAWNHYSGDAVSSIISKEKTRRKETVI